MAEEPFGSAEGLPYDVPGQLDAQEDAARSVEPTGRFRLYIGMAAGVGKTVAMLDEGARRAQRGSDVVVGFCETHGRAYTAQKLDGLEVVPRRVVEYRGARFEEMDLDAVLARQPEVALIDELAHTNVPGSGRHEKRWEDVIEILDAGIAVVSTVNVQHLESIADAVEHITGTTIRERVPDWVVRKADQLELIDSSPEQLRRRMLHGNVYPKEKIPAALGGFFRSENLVALRELVLRFIADETDDELLGFLERHRPKQVWETRERIMVAVTSASGMEGVIRRAARIAARVKTDLVAVHVRGDDRARTASPEETEALAHLAEDVGATWAEITGEDTAAALVEYARVHQITQIVVGSSRRRRFEELARGSVVYRLLRLAAATGIDVHVIARGLPNSDGRRATTSDRSPER